MKLLPSRRVLCTPYNHAPCHFMQSHIREVYACLAVTCHLHIWQNDQGLLRATAVNIKITSRTCRFETYRYLRLPNFKTHFLRTGHVFSSVPQSNQSSPPSLCLSRTHARTQTHTRSEAQNQYIVRQTGSQANCEVSSTIFQVILVILVLPTKFRHYVYCL